MKFVLFCEGATEKSALPDFLRRWLNSKLPVKVGIQPVAFNGWAEMVRDSPKKAELHLRNPDVIAVVALLDLYGPNFYPPDRQTAAEQYEWAKEYLESSVKSPRFRQHFAVHDVEAWILSDPDNLPRAVRKKLPIEKIAKPEMVNFDEPPAYLLNRLYREATNRDYKKRTYGEELFRKLDPLVVWQKCPYFRKLADDLVYLSQKALAKPSSP
jgi:hypothetical protein